VFTVPWQRESRPAPASSPKLWTPIQCRALGVNNAAWFFNSASAGLRSAFSTLGWPAVTVAGCLCGHSKPHHFLCRKTCRLRIANGNLHLLRRRPRHTPSWTELNQRTTLCPAPCPPETQRQGRWFDVSTSQKSRFRVEGKKTIGSTRWAEHLNWKPPPQGNHLSEPVPAAGKNDWKCGCLR